MTMDENRKEERPKRKREKRRRKLIFIGCGVLISVLFLGILFCTGQLGIRTTLGVASVEQYNLIEAEGIEQEIEINYNYLDSIFMFIANMEEGQEGTLGLKLVDEEDEIVFSNEYSLKKIETGTFQKLTVHKFLKPGKYTLTVNYSGDIPEFGIPKVMVLGEEKNMEETGKCYLNGQIQKENLALGYVFYQFPYWLWIAIAAVIPLFAFLALESD